MTKTDKVIDKLNKLIQLDYDAIEAYAAAVDKLENPGYKEQVAKFGEDHVRHTQELSALVDGYGGTAATGPDLKRLLTKGKVVIADLVGGDRAILTAMVANEEVTNKTYESALADLSEAGLDGADTRTREIVAANLADERRHRAWFEQQVEREKAAA